MDDDDGDEATIGIPSTEPASSSSGGTFDDDASSNGELVRVVDDFDGYSLAIPKGWIPVTTAGADLFYRNVNNVEQNLFVTFSSRSSSAYSTLASDIGPPGDAGALWLNKYLGEFMSTRIGIQRKGKLVDAKMRKIQTESVNGIAGSGDGIFYDILVNIQSFATRNQYGISSGDRPQVLEWDRNFLTTIGISGNRLYELRLQCNAEDFDRDRANLVEVLHSFRLIDAKYDKENADGAAANT